MRWLGRLIRPDPDRPDPDRLSVRHGEQSFDIELRRRDAARRMTLRVSSATGATVLTAPPRVPLPTVRAFADSHAGWIAARKARLPERIGFAPGSVVPLRDVPHRIVHWSAARGPTKGAVDPEGHPVIAVAGGLEAVPGRVRRFLAAEALADLEAAVRRHTGTLGVPVGRVTVRDTTSRWGSCSSTGTLSFSWRLILAPPFVLDYLAAHEVAHLKELNHSHRFWKIVHDLCPGTQEAETWLRRNGAGLHRFG